MKTIKILTEKDWTDITDDVVDFAKDYKDGLVHIFSKHTTLMISIFEKEILLMNDVFNKLEEFAPRNGSYGHDNIGIRNVPRGERKNGFAHVRSLLFNTSDLVPVRDGVVVLGQWQRIFAVELDGCREREIVLTFLPEHPNEGK
jgi:secondary thiamine-phosphate synthase enzyme